jgi:hypothetical protein
MQPLTVPAQMIASTDVVRGIDVIAGTADRPALRSGPLLAFRSADTGRTWAEPVTVAGDGRA